MLNKYWKHLLKSRGVTLALLCLSFIGLKAQLSERTANYDMNITLDEVNHKLLGVTQLVWNNPSGDTIYYLPFHLYYNAFKDTRSTFMKESDGFSDFLRPGDNDCHWSWTQITNFSDSRKQDLTDQMFFDPADDGNIYDQTVLRIPLKTPILPFAQDTFNFSWEAQIPNIKPRTGYNKEFYFFAQWFPKIGVYEPTGVRGAKEGRWNCHQYHASGEYYADFGNYDVRLNIPENYQVVASGQLQNQTIEGERKISHFRVEDVIDFTWSCSPHFVLQKDKWNDVELIYVSYPEHKHVSGRYFTAVKMAMEYLDKYIGKYPYPTLSMIDPPMHGIFTGGMEYPTIITSLNFCFLPKNLRTTETLVVHEFIHQYFMQMVATHEVEDTWMDEGITTYYENRILDHYYGEKTSLSDCFGLTIGSGEYNRAEFFAMDNPKIAPNSCKSHEFHHGGYGPIQYNKTAVWLRTLEGLMGQSCFDEAMKHYFETWKFKHPGPDDFIQAFKTVSETCPEINQDLDLDHFFDQAIKGTEMCDYSVAQISNDPILKDEGYLENYEDCITPTGSKSKGLKSSYVLHRLGEVILPVEILVSFEDSTSVLDFWDGKSRSFEKEYINHSKIVAVQIDPKYKIPLDHNYLNNGLIVKEEKKALHQIFLSGLRRAQHLLESVNGIL